MIRFLFILLEVITKPMKEQMNLERSWSNVCISIKAFYRVKF
jgi:hypothetical protein